MKTNTKIPQSISAEATQHFFIESFRTSSKHVCCIVARVFSTEVLYCNTKNTLIMFPTTNCG